ENFLKLYNDIKIVHISPYIFMNGENFKFFNEIKRENKIFLTNLSIPILDNQRFLKILNKFDYIFMNLEEAKKLTKKENLEEIKKFLKKNFENSIITLMDGLYFLNKEEEVFLETEEINKKINIGAGDYLIGGFISGLYRNLRIEDCLKFGIESVKNYLNFIK
ncbi:MAG TPA: PfkB family carbohydrate kinase, partial [Caldisericia bacterium]|nr:PfkB family carbohydrate kinase [Caldisericia bacterium]